MAIYQIEHLDTGFGAVIEINPSPETLIAITETVQFWSGWEDELDDCDGDYAVCFLKKLGHALVLLSLRHGYNATGMIEHLKGEEGWPTLDGSCGIRIVDVDCDASFGFNDISVREIG